MRQITLLILLALPIFLSAQPGDMEMMMRLEQQHREDLYKKIQEDPTNEKLLRERLNMDLRGSLDWYKKEKYDFDRQFLEQINYLIFKHHEEAELYYSKGKLLYHYGHYEEAIEPFKTGLSLCSDKVLKKDFLYALAGAYLLRSDEVDMEDRKTALDYLEMRNSIEGIEPLQREKVYLLGLLNMHKELHEYHTENALNTLKEYIKVYKEKDNYSAYSLLMDCIDDLYESAELYYKDREFESAIKLMESVTDCVSKNSSGETLNLHIFSNCHLLLSKIYSDNCCENEEKAIDHFILSLGEPSMGLMYETESRKLLEKLSSLYSNNPKFRFAAALFNYKYSWNGARTREDLLNNQIMPDLGYASDYGYDNFKINIMLAIKEKEYKHYDKALEQIELAIGKNPKNPYPYEVKYQILRNIPKTTNEEYNKVNELAAKYRKVENDGIKKLKRLIEEEMKRY